MAVTTRTAALALLVAGALAASFSLGSAQFTFQDRSFGGNNRQNLRMAKALNGSESHFDEVLRNILVPRVVGTSSHQKVKEYIIGQMRGLGWQVETTPFYSKTPNFGSLLFENIIARVNPSAKQVLVLSCHYDSKYFTNIEFLGATDSAVPCAMLINLAHALQNELPALKATDVGLELWFFDGEEAFVRWGPNDSIYGSRYLATKMEKENTLGKIKLFVLLDLLGTPGPYFYSYSRATEGAYRTLASGEKFLAASRHLKAVGSNNGFRGRRLSYFQDNSVSHAVEDDHTPFLQRGVPVLHIIPHKFPDVWHTKNDNWNAIDRPTVEDLNKIMRMFVLNYLNL
ncbi:glutaminyl-peptide cyclotransferase-like [Thrips palmi]|uniref:Glutaminyl-peptide cyclotransferase n=1 Tax=Thrips palmi TaxID=161013 RepID=A0A6P8ZA30_THRPL|nr:glutaminyl-peptide cyclotransferase-like [Thrips palmi]XP_034247545.1 glutaminyl-peptide cyclotransferase-like [Thrips palmi]